MITFHDWLIGQTGNDNAVEDIARDYQQGLALELHGEATSPNDLRMIVRRFVGEDSPVEPALDDVEREW